ncbi:MAG: BrnT family toxin [Flavobacteriaceae bacterium]|nr:BrnT family toxin [Flavobacteriaceae bacterium]
MDFEWDEYKRQSNLEKHGVDFRDAAKIFLNPTLDRLDDREPYPEERFIAIGYGELGFFVVIYTWRKNKRRIISAWKAGKNEKREYQKLFN